MGDPFRVDPLTHVNNPGVLRTPPATDRRRLQRLTPLLTGDAFSVLTPLLTGDAFSVLTPLLTGDAFSVCRLRASIQARNIYYFIIFFLPL